VRPFNAVDFSQVPALRDEHHSIENGVMVMKQGVWRLWDNPTATSYAFEVVGRVVGGSAWGVILAREEADGFKGGLLFELDGQGRFRIDGAPFQHDLNPTVKLPWTPHPAIRKGEGFNTLLVVLRGRQLEVYVNQRAVCKPLTLDRDITPSVALGRRGPSGETKGTAEIRGRTAWTRLDDVPPADRRLLAAAPPPPPDPLAWPAAELKAGTIAGPDLSQTRSLVEDHFNDPKSGFVVGRTSDGADHGYVGGDRYQVVLAGAGTSHAYLRPGRFVNQSLTEDMACEVIGRVAGENARWGLGIQSFPGSLVAHRVVVMLQNNGELLVLEGPAEETPGRRLAVKHSKILPGDAANRLATVLRGGRVLEVYVNGVAVCDPLVLDEPILSPRLSLVCLSPSAKGAVAEFLGVTVWPAEGLSTAEQRGAVRKPK
jgi:hypothetical protein